VLVTVIIIIIIIHAKIKVTLSQNAEGALYKQQCHVSHVCRYSNSNYWHIGPKRKSLMEQCVLLEVCLGMDSPLNGNSIVSGQTWSHWCEWQLEGKECSWEWQ